MRPPIVLPEDAAARPAALDPAGVVTGASIRPTPRRPERARRAQRRTMDGRPPCADQQGAITLGKDEPILDGDPIVDAQVTRQISGLTQPRPTGPKQAAQRPLARFLNFGAPKEVRQGNT